MRRAGLDYREYAKVMVYENLAECLGYLGDKRIFPCTTKGGAEYAGKGFQKEDVFLFGPESRGLPSNILSKYPQDKWLRIPMLPESRSLNLSNAVAVMVYEAWRQQGFIGSATKD